MTEKEEKYNWLVIFRKDGKIYCYMSRTVFQMSAMAKANHDKDGSYPYRVWVIVDDEIQKVLIT